MNYYQHHIGDFNNATRHLTRIERSIYRDMMELYYDTEKPLPLDVAVICRKVMARNEEEKSAVLALLDEFFNPMPEGYRHDRCEQELANAAGAMNEAKDRRDNEKERQRRNRERRAALFAQLRDYDDIPPWNTSTEALMSRINTHLSRVTGCDNTVTQQVQTGPATATQLPLTITHLPLPITHIPKEEQIPPIPPRGGEVEKNKKSAISFVAYIAQCKELDIKAIPEDCPVFAYAQTAGIPEDFLRLQWLEFRDRYSEVGAKRYKAWPIVFGKSVRGNWFKLWYFDKDNNCILTTTGIQAQNTHEARK